MMIDAMISAAWISTETTRGRSRGGWISAEKGESFASAIVVHPIARRQEGEGGEDGNDDHEDPGERCRISHAKEAEGLLIEIERIEERRVDRTAGARGDDVFRREGLEGVDRLDHGIEEDDRRQ